MYKISKTRGGSNINENTKFANNNISNGSLLFFVIFILLSVITGLLVYICCGSKDKSMPNDAHHLTPTTIVEINKLSSDKFNDPYSPPLKNDGTFLPIDNNSVATNRNINIQTRGYIPDFTQIGILTRDSKTTHTLTHEPKILPLMGRRIMNGRDKYQYYTISNSGNVNTKLPIRKEGRNCINEYGCDQLYSGDHVFVEGYDERFKATIYENALFRYIP
jgi:hypothetical protein